MTLANNNIQEVNVNYVSGYPMISPHSNNKEVIKEKIWYPMRYTVTTISYWLYYTQQLDIYHLHEPLFTIILHYVLYS